MFADFFLFLPATILFLKAFLQPKHSINLHSKIKLNFSNFLPNSISLSKFNRDGSFRSASNRLYVFRLWLIVFVGNNVRNWKNVFAIKFTSVDASGIGAAGRSHFNWWRLFQIERWERFSEVSKHQIGFLCWRLWDSRIWWGRCKCEIVVLCISRFWFFRFVFVSDKRSQNDQNDDCKSSSGADCHQQKISMRLAIDRHFRNWKQKSKLRVSSFTLSNHLPHSN